MPLSLSVSARVKLYLILAFTSLALLFYEVAQIAYVISTPADLLGLVSHFTLPYWIGLGTIFLCSVLIFLDREIKDDAVFIFVLIVFGLFLLGVATLVQENVRSPSAYFNLTSAKTLLATGSFDIGGRYTLELYSSWPGAHFLHSSAMITTGLTLKEVMSFMPFLWLIIFILVTYFIGKRFGLSPNRCFLLSFLALSSYWMMQTDFSPQGMAVVLYLFCFAFLVNLDRPYVITEIILYSICFATLIITHGVTSMVFILSLAVLAIYRFVRRQPIPLIALSVLPLWIIWYLLPAREIFNMGLRKLLSAPWSSIFTMGVRVEGIYDPTYTFTSALINLYSQVAYILLFITFIAIAFYLLLRGKIERNNRKWVILLVIWLFGYALSGFIFPNQENYVRLLMLALVPITGITVMMIASRKVLITIMSLVMLLLLPARYSLEGYSGQVLCSELAGVHFFGDYTGPIEPWFFYREGDLMLLPFYNPDILIWPVKGYTPEMKTDDLYQASYVLCGKLGSGQLFIDDWLKTGGAEAAELVYNNGSFKIYKNQLPQEP